DVERHSGAASQLDGQLHQETIFWFAGQPSHHARDARGKVYGLRSVALGLGHRTRRMRSIGHPFRQVVSDEMFQGSGQAAHSAKSDDGLRSVSQAKRAAQRPSVAQVSSAM